jgi:hypothetical protein
VRETFAAAISAGTGWFFVVPPPNTTPGAKTAVKPSNSRVRWGRPSLS